MNKNIVSLLFVILLFSCDTKQGKDLTIKFDQTTIFIDDHRKNGEVILENFQFTENVSSQQLNNSINYLVELSEKNLIARELFSLEEYSSIEELIYKNNKETNIKLKFRYDQDPSIILNEIYLKILNIDSKSYYSEEYETVLVTYFSSCSDINFNSQGSEHISVNEETISSDKSKYITTWDKTKGPYKIQFSKLFEGHDFETLVDVVSTASLEN